MTPEEFKTLQSFWKVVDVIKPEHFQNRSNRMLLTGYDIDRNSFTVELYENEIFVKVKDYRGTKEIKTHEEISDNEEYVPNKRVYPELADFEFCKLLKQRGVYIPFTTFKDTERGS